jgi:hypothetical protein
VYKAINTRDGTAIIILDPRWANALDYLRSLDAQDFLVCQRCRQPLRVRAGQIKRWHFAHKHLLNCPYGQESPELLDARAVLYEWLTTKFGDKVIIEKTIDSTHFERPVDCWIERGSASIAYWIIDKATMPDGRDSIRKGFSRLKVTVNWLFTSSMLREDQDKLDCVHLTTTEREFMQHTAYDPVVSNDPDGKSLHYLDAENRTLTTFRGLHLIHSPQLFKGHRLSHTVAEVLVAPETGEFVHPGEYERLQEYRQQQAELEKQLRQAEEAQAKRGQSWRQPVAECLSAQEPKPFQEIARPSTLPVVRPRWMALLENEPKPINQADKPTVYQAEAVCEFCGKKTTDWWYFDPKTGLCKCRTCYQQGKY